MFQVIDLIQVSAALVERHPDTLAEGLWLILDPEQTRGVDLPRVGQSITIEKPDGIITRVALDGAAAPHGDVGLHFRHLNRKAVPRLSKVSW